MPGIEPRPADHESNALPLHQTTFGVSETPVFRMLQTRRESSPDCQRKTSSIRRMRKIKHQRAQARDLSPRAAPGSRFQSNVLTTRLRVGILKGNQNWSNLRRSGDVQTEIKLPWPMLRCITSCCATLRCITLHSVALHYVMLHCNLFMLFKAIQF